MFTGPYGVFENGTLSELAAVQKEYLRLVPDNVDNTAAAGLPVAYLTAFLVLKAAGFEARKTVLAPAIGGSVGNAVTQLARARGAKHAISTTTGHAKAEEAKVAGGGPACWRKGHDVPPQVHPSKGTAFMCAK